MLYNRREWVDVQLVVETESSGWTAEKNITVSTSIAGLTRPTRKLDRNAPLSIAKRFIQYLGFGTPNLVETFEQSLK